jgi:hypothetical protein
VIADYRDFDEDPHNRNQKQRDGYHKQRLETFGQAVDGEPNKISADQDPKGVVAKYRNFSKDSRGKGKDFADKEEADSVGLIRFAIMAGNAYFEAMPPLHDATTGQADGEKICAGADLMITRFACWAARWLSTASSRAPVSTAPSSSGFPPAPIGGIMGHGRPRNPHPPRHRNRRQRYSDDFAVIWRGMSVGRIMLGNGAPHDRPQWTWSCHFHGRPQGGDDRGNAANLVDAKARFKKAWTRIRASLTDQDIADAQQIAALSAEALARHDRRYGR